MDKKKKNEKGEGNQDVQGGMLLTGPAKDDGTTPGFSYNEAAVHKVPTRDAWSDGQKPSAAKAPEGDKLAAESGATVDDKGNYVLPNGNVYAPTGDKEIDALHARGEETEEEKAKSKAGKK